MAASLAVICVMAALLGLFADGQRTCPPEDFDAVEGLDLIKFTAAPWFSQQQIPLSFQPVDQLYCVRARYVLEDVADATKGIKMLYYANVGKVNGPAISTAPNSTHVELSGIIPDPEEASKFVVAPTFVKQFLQRTLAQFFVGDHWIVAVGPSEDPRLGYSWAIVSAGPPLTQGKDGCLTSIAFLGLFPVHEGGLWLLTRKPVDPENTVFMRNVAKALGYDVSVIVDVAQSGCTYEGAP